MRRAVSGCNFVAQGNDDSEVMRKTAEHARSVHKMVAIAMESSGKREQQFGMPEASPDRIRAPDTVEGLQQIEPVAPFHL